ncbi:amidohydrolase family protein [Streptomyces aculeolatus]
MIIDAHCHVWRRWPYTPDVPDPRRRGSVRALLYEMDQANVDRALVVCARIGGTDRRTANPDNNHFVAAAVTRHPDRLAAVVDVDSRWSAEYHRPGAADRLAAAVTATGAVGVTHYLANEDDGWLQTDEAKEFFRRAAALGLIVSLHAPPCWLRPLADLVSGVPDVPVLLHHQGLVTPGSPAFRADMQALEALAGVGDVYVKLSGFHYLTDRPWDFPYRDTRAVIRALLAAFGPGRLVWGSDYPVSRPHLTYRQSIEVIREHADLDRTDLDAVLGGTMAHLLTRGGGGSPTSRTGNGASTGDLSRDSISRMHVPNME